MDKGAIEMLLVMFTGVRLIWECYFLLQLIQADRHI